MEGGKRHFVQMLHCPASLSCPRQQASMKKATMGVRHILLMTNAPEVGSMHASTAHALVELQQLLPLFKRPEEWSQRAHIHRVARHSQKVIQHPSDLAVHNTDVLPTFCT